MAPFSSGKVENDKVSSCTHHLCGVEDDGDYAGGGEAHVRRELKVLLQHQGQARRGHVRAGGEVVEEVEEVEVLVEREEEEVEVEVEGGGGLCFSLMWLQYSNRVWKVWEQIEHLLSW